MNEGILFTLFGRRRSHSTPAVPVATAAATAADTEMVTIVDHSLSNSERAELEKIAKEAKTLCRLKELYQNVVEEPDLTLKHQKYTAYLRARNSVSGTKHFSRSSREALLALDGKAMSLFAQVSTSSSSATVPRK